LITRTATLPSTLPIYVSLEDALVLAFYRGNMKSRYRPVMREQAFRLTWSV